MFLKNRKMSWYHESWRNPRLINEFMFHSWLNLANFWPIISKIVKLGLWATNGTVVLGNYSHFKAQLALFLDLTGPLFDWWFSEVWWIALQLLKVTFRLDNSKFTSCTETTDGIAVKPCEVFLEKSVQIWYFPAFFSWGKKPLFLSIPIKERFMVDQPQWALLWVIKIGDNFSNPIQNSSLFWPQNPTRVGLELDRNPFEIKYLIIYFTPMQMSKVWLFSNSCWEKKRYPFLNLGANRQEFPKNKKNVEMF